MRELDRDQPPAGGFTPRDPGFQPGAVAAGFRKPWQLWQQHRGWYGGGAPVHSRAAGPRSKCLAWDHRSPAAARHALPPATQAPITSSRSRPTQRQLKVAVEILSALSAGEADGLLGGIEHVP